VYDISMMCSHGTVLIPTSTTYTQLHDNKHIVTFYDYKLNSDSTRQLPSLVTDSSCFWFT